MKDVSYFQQIYLCVEPVDFRKQANGLALMVENLFPRTLSEGRILFVFRNRGAKAIKMLYWDGTGIALWSKKLEEEKFKWPKKGQEAVRLTASELKLILQGVDIAKISKHKVTKFQETA